MKKYEVEEYATGEGVKPFGEWLLGLRDSLAKAKLLARINRAAHGNFGDWKSIKNAPGLFEMREHYGPGYRIYYAIVQGKLILLLAGSTKRDQNAMIAAAKKRLADYQERSQDDE
jgi:putative addiction module killer protein